PRPLATTTDRPGPTSSRSLRRHLSRSRHGDLPDRDSGAVVRNQRRRQGSHPLKTSTAVAGPPLRPFPSEPDLGSSASPRPRPAGSRQPPMVMPRNVTKLAILGALLFPGTAGANAKYARQQDIKIDAKLSERSRPIVPRDPKAQSPADRPLSADQALAV